MKRRKNYTANSPQRPVLKKKLPYQIKIANKIAERKKVTLKELTNENYNLDSLYKSLNGVTPRLLSAAKELNIGKDTLVEYLSTKNFQLSSSPATKLSFPMYLELIKEFKPEFLKGFEINGELGNINDNRGTIALSFMEGKFVLKQQMPDGSVVVSSGIESKQGVFFPYFSSTTAALSELEELINDPHVSEVQLQKFLERYPELILDDDYKVAIPQARIITDDNSWEADFMLIPHNQIDFCKILELKLPSEKVNNKERNGHQAMSAKLNHALQQIKDYYHAFNNPTTRKKFKEKYGSDIYRPDLQLIIGRKGDFQFKDSYRDFQKESTIKIIDWDSFLEKKLRKFR